MEKIPGVRDEAAVIVTTNVCKFKVQKEEMFSHTVAYSTCTHKDRCTYIHIESLQTGIMSAEG